MGIIITWEADVRGNAPKWESAYAGLRVSGNAPKWAGTRLEWGTDRRSVKREFPLACLPARRYVREHAEDPTALR